MDSFSSEMASNLVWLFCRFGLSIVLASYFSYTRKYNFFLVLLGFSILSFYLSSSVPLFLVHVKEMFEGLPWKKGFECWLYIKIPHKDSNQHWWRKNIFTSVLQRSFKLSPSCSCVSIHFRSNNEIWFYAIYCTAYQFQQ